MSRYIASMRQRLSWDAFRAGQRAKLNGFDRSACTWSQPIEGSGLSEHDRKIFEKSWMDGYDKPNK